MKKNATTYYQAKACTKRIQIHQGGTRSGKTWSLLQVLAEWCYSHQNWNHIITICRKTLPALKATAMRDFLEIIDSAGWYDVKYHNRSEHTYKLFGNLIEFVSIDESQKIRGRKRNMLFLNEANELTIEDWRQLILRTSPGPIILDFNPSDEFSWIYDEAMTREDAAFFQTNYKDNPHLPDELIREIELLKTADPNYWRVYGMGERGSSPAVIFPSWHGVDTIPENAKLVAHGLDFGFTNDPTSLVSVYNRGHELYMKCRLYQTGLTNLDIGEKLTELGIGREPIVADSAEPKSIEELSRLGFSIRGAIKGPDSVRMGIDILRRHRLHVTNDSPDLIKELRNYKWQTDKNGQQVNRPESSGWDHAIDAARYVCQNHLATNKRGKYFIS